MVRSAFPSAEEAAGKLFVAEREREPIQPLSDRYSGLTLADAYDVQSAYTQLRVARGARAVGRKIGATSEAIQRQFGVETPDFGVLLDDMMFADGAALERDRLINPRVEAELAFFLGRNLRGPGVTQDAVLVATTRIAPAIEVIDSRIVDWRIRLVDTVADNGSGAMCVTGDGSIPLDTDLASVRVTLSKNGRQVGAGRGADVLGHPAAAVAWLANTLATLGAELQAGDIIYSGSFTAAEPAEAGDEFVADFAGLGLVRCRFGS